jgi:sugar/nucleoside kinase (ribokinase family)
MKRDSSVCDVLGLGCSAVDDLLYVRHYPPPDAKAEVIRRERHCGGLTTTALVAASRLGARCAFAGTLGQDEESQFVLETLRREGVDTRHVVFRTDAGPVRSTIVVDETRRSRNIFFDVQRVRGADPNRPAKKIILGARVLLVDRYGIRGMLRAARLARRAGIPVVGDFESSHAPRLRELLALTDHLILSERFACQLAGVSHPAKAAQKLWRKDRSVVVVTCGERGGWSYEGSPYVPEPFRAFRVRAVDTTGCGDVFHGAYAAALARGLSLEERLQFAAAAAALKTTKPGGQTGIPTRAAVERFLKAKGR